MNNNELRYGFGKNWQSFVTHSLDAKRIGKAANSLRRLLQVEHLRGQSLLDIGCGSGLFSLAACLLGAERVTAFDYDIDSVRTSEALRQRAGIASERWQIQQGSVLDPAFLSTIEPADIVYSWGVLHHTGSMWQAIDEAVTKVRPGGTLVLAIYNHQERLIGGSAMWWQIKRFYNQSPPPLRRLTELAYVGALGLRDASALRGAAATWRGYTGGDVRGMDFWHDVRDWLGGFPYEYASTSAVASYLTERWGLQPIQIIPCQGYGCNEFVFRR